MDTDYKKESLWLPAIKKAVVVVFYALLLCLVLFLVIWHFVLNNEAVYRSISLAPGIVKQDFRLNYSGYYSMGIQVERKFPHRTLQCLLGISDFTPKDGCKDTPAVLQYSWTLSCNGGRMTQSGSSEKIIGGAYTKDTMEAEFGGFQGKWGERCRLEMNFFQDARGTLSGANPKLHIYTELF
jgi:hypothetical protein